MKERINILLASDANYAPYYGVMLTSLFLNNYDELFDVYFLTDKTLSHKDTVRFESLTEKYNANLYVIPVDVDLVKTFPEVAHIKLPAYYHLSLSKLLPESVHKIIYMDGDMIVNGHIRPLWDLDISKYACAQVPNCTYFDDSYYNRLGYDRKWGYYNNGVAIYNLDYLRTIQFSDLAIRYINENRENILWMDQDAENALLYDKMLSLPFTYNFQTLFFDIHTWNTYTNDFKKNVLNAANNPVVIHYCGLYKPWTKKYYLLPYGRLWKEYRKKSLWKNLFDRDPLLKKCKFFLKFILKPNSFVQFRNSQCIPEAYSLW